MSDISETKLKCPIAVKWMIPEDRLIEMKDKLGKGLTSEYFNAFNIPGLQYYISIYPNGAGENISGETWIYLHLEFSHSLTITADFKISFESADQAVCVKQIYRKRIGWGIKCCLTEELFDPEHFFIVDGALTIKLDGILMAQKYAIKKEESIPNHADALCLGLWEQEETKDFAVVAEGKEIRAHKNVLSARSPVFVRMFQSGMKEAEEGKVAIKDFTFDIVEAAIKSCYHKSLVPEASLEDAVKLLQFFDKYDIQSLKDDLEAQLIAILNSSNVCLLTNCAILTNARKLEKECSEFLQKCFEKRRPISDIDLLDKDFALNIFKSAFYHVSKLYSPTN